MTGFVRDYLVYICGFIILIVGGAAIKLDGISFDFSQDSQSPYMKLYCWLVCVATAITVLLTKSRMISIIAIGTLGFLVVFLLFSLEHLTWHLPN